MQQQAYRAQVLKHTEVVSLWCGFSEGVGLERIGDDQSEGRWEGQNRWGQLGMEGEVEELTR